MNWQDVVIGPVKSMITRILNFIPTLIGALLILLVGWFVAKALEWAVNKALKALKVDNLSETTGIADILEKGEIKKSLSEIIGAIVYWLVMLTVLVTAVNALGLTTAAELLDKVVLYIPNVIGAIFILVLGIFFASFIGTLVKTAAVNARLTQSNALAQTSRVVVTIFAVIIALAQLNIKTAVLDLTISIVLASLGIGFAIALGLGCKDIVGRFAEDLVGKFKSKK